jgi:hypothetical protein
MRQAGHPPALRVIPVTLSNNDGPVAESSRTAAGRVATAGDCEIDLTDEAHRAADPSAGPLVSQLSATLVHPTPQEDDAPPIFENSDEELEYLWRKDDRLEKQREIKHLRTRVLCKATHQRGELLDALAEPPPPKRTFIAKLPTRRVTVLPPDYAGHKQKDLAVFIHKIETVLEFDAA